MELANSLYQLRHRAVRAVASRTTRIWDRAMRGGRSTRSNDALRNMYEAMDRLYDDELHSVEAGDYPASLAHRVTLFEHLRVAPLALADGPRMLWRRWRNDFQHLPKDVDLEAYPHYYRRNFHWQPDGWFSRHSARVYDATVELLFWGAADVMRRRTLPHLRELKDRERPRILDVACGTGRFLDMLHVAFPRARLYGVDLSPHYIAYAREHVDPSVSLLNENAENLPLESQSFDAAVSIFLFHELPHDARRNVLKEVHRVLAPGARFVVCDSLQRKEADDMGLTAFSESFPETYHEPYYKGYLADDLATVMRGVGFEVESDKSHGVAKVVVGRRARA